MFRIAISAVATAAAFGALATPAGAICTEEVCPPPSDGGPPVVTSSASTDLAGAAFYEPAGERVAIDSRLHLTSRYRPAEEVIELHANVNRARATGESSGGRYALTGADQVAIIVVGGLPPNPIRTSVAFRLQPSPPPIRGLPPDPIRVAVTLDLAFDERGALEQAVASLESDAVH